jgi:3'-5' exoribonuclease 1
MKYIVLDLESTCRDTPADPGSREIIEIGAIRLDDSLSPDGEYNRFVRPIANPQLSQFCMDLTRISQSEVDKADPFIVVFPDFLEWIGEGSYSIATWGEYDIKQIQIDCKRHSLKFPKRFSKKHINVKECFAEKKHTRPCGMTQALQMMNILPTGTHHRGIDDARNITTIFKRLWGH